MSKQGNRKQLDATFKKVAAEWKKFAAVKKKIQSKKIPYEFKPELISEAKRKTKIRITAHFKNYQSYKYVSSHKSSIKGFGLSKYYETTAAKQITFRALKGTGEVKYNRTIANTLNKKGVSGVVAIIKIKDEETGRISYISDFITKGLQKRLDKKGISIYDHVAEHAKGLRSADEFQQVGLYMRVVYAKA